MIVILYLIGEGLAPAGRLDIDSTGLLILTQDGTMAKKIIGENVVVEKEYLVKVQGDLTDENLKTFKPWTHFRWL